MKSEKVANFAARTAIGPFGSRMKSDVYTESGVPIIRGTNLTGGKVLAGGWVYVSEKTADDLANCCVFPGDIVFPHRGAIGEVGIVPDEFPRYVMSSSLMTLSCDRAKADPDYIYYFFKSAAGRHELLKNSSQVGTPGIGQPLSTLRAIEVPLPPLGQQREIAKNLSDLDAKIDLNHRINQTLEAMAQAIFKSWFVDFDPVKAKIAAKTEGRDPLRAAMSAISGKTDAELDALPPEQHAQLVTTAALFPDEMEESELGAVPRGWNVTTVGSVATITKGNSYSSKDLVADAHTALVTLKSFERGGGFRMDGFKAYVGPFKPSQVVEPGELIVAYTDVTQAAELIGRPAIVVGVKKYQTLVASLDVGIVRPNQDLVSRQYLYGLFSTDTFQSHTFAHTTGTTVLHLGRDGVPSFKFPRPPTDLIKRYSCFADPVVKLKQDALDQSSVLTELRDALLPRLLSGELPVQDIEAEAAA